MCGIYGYVTQREKINPEIMHRMGRALAHRGPDDEGEMTENSNAVRRTRA
jgi:Asparagine synthase (glutamine-hydrolyzing)